jgi:hypothetical protein
MDHQFYRELIPGTAWVGQDPPEEAIAGSIKSSLGYESGLMLSVNGFVSGKFILNTLLIQNNLGTHPAAERLLRNLINYAARDRKKPVEKLPPDFDIILENIGYK